MRQNNAIVPRDFKALSAPTGNVYQTAVIIAKRAKQNATKTTEELRHKLAHFNTKSMKSSPNLPLWPLKSF